jgi:penicillin-binding protein A
VNSRIRRLAVGLLVCYLVLFVQLNVLQVGRSEELQADTRNNRQVVRDFNRFRGPILSADEQVLALSVPLEGEKFDYQRTYPTGELFANVTGYYSFTFGATQIEKTKNDVLAGRTSEQQVGAITDILDPDATSAGTVVLTLDSRLQAAARDLLGGREGSIVALDPRDGAVLAMYSWPTFDPNQVAVHDSAAAGKVLEFLNAAPGKPLLANAYQERYMPGSTFKMVTTAVALDEGVVNTVESFWPDENEYLPPLTTDPIENYGGTTCGGDLAAVFRRSCNTPFARTAVELGPVRMTNGAERFLLNQALPIDLPRPAASNFGAVADFDQATPLLAIRGFGQNEVALTPLHMAAVAGSVANGGQMMQPHVVKETRDSGGNVLSRVEPEVISTTMSSQTAATLNELMVGVVNDGTAKCCMQLTSGFQAAAKTGTAQLNKKGEPERSHAWIAAFAPAEAPEVVVAVMLKGVNDEISTGTGGKLAGPLAQQFLDTYFSIRAGG